MGSDSRHPRLGRLAGVVLRTQPDERLVAMASEGAAAPFDELVRRHRPALIAFAGSIAPASRAEDVVQESLLKAYVALQDGARPDLVRAWLFRIVRNTAIDDRRVTRDYAQLDENYDGIEQPAEVAARREQLGGLLVAIRDLPPAQREAIVKREFEGRGHAEIGRVLNLSPGSVRQLIYRARASLREAAGAVIPAAVIRAACTPGAGEAVGGVGMAGALKLGLAAVLATGTIVAGTSIEKGGEPPKAEALPLPTLPDGGRSSSGGPAPSDQGAGVRHPGGQRHSGAPERERGDSGEHGSSGEGTSGSNDSDHSGSGEGTSGSGEGTSGSGSGGGDDGGSDHEGSDDVGSSSGGSEGGSGTSGEGPSGEGVSGGGEVETPDGSGGDDGPGAPDNSGESQSSD